MEPFWLKASWLKLGRFDALLRVVCLIVVCLLCLARPVQNDRKTERQRDRETERQRDRETERQRDRETERERER